MKRLIISVDFDGCLVDDAFPMIGDLKPYAAEVLKKWLAEGHYIIINSCRAGDREKDMREFLDGRGIFYDAINNNLQERILRFGSDTRKISADVYIDDKNIFCHNIDWLEIEREISRISGRA